MKKLLSICLLSVLLTMMSFFTAQAQSSNPACCFWVENMQPVTAQHIANLDGTGIAKDTSAGMPLVLNNVLNRAVVGNTDVYTLHFPTGADCGSKVSIEWLVYRDGQLLNGNLSDYADLGIYTRFDQINNGVCERINWLGGIVDNGDGVCGCNPSTWHVDHNDFPGARQANPTTPAYFDETHPAAGYQHVLYTYNFDYFYLPFLASNHSTTNVIINWKQVGNYSLVIRIRERIGGTDYDFTMDGSQDPSQYIGGHQSCCGQILYQDSLHYLVTTASEKSICDGETFMYGRGQETASGSTLYSFTEESLYYVLFGDYVCDHWEVERIDTLQLYTRINPDIVAKDTNLCRDENFNAADLLGLVTEVDLDAPGIIGHEIRWSENGVSWTTDMSQLLSLNQLTQTAGQYEFYARQFNFYYDAMDDDTIGCGGQIDTVVVNVRDLFPPVLEGPHYFSYCNENLAANSPIVLRAHLNPQDFCSTEIRWYTEDDNGYPTHAAAYLKQVGDTISLDLTQMNPVNEDKVITYYLYAINTNTNTFSAKYDSVTFEFFMTPEFVVDSTQLDFVVCPGASVTMNSMVSSIEPDYNDVLPTVTYEWFKNNVSLSNDTNFAVNASMVCNHVDTYTVHITATTIKGCSSEMTRTYTIKAQDIVNPIIAWVDTIGTYDANGNRLVTMSGCDSSDVPAPYTLNNFLSMRVAPTPGSTTTTGGSTATARTYIGTIIDGCSNVDSLTVTDVVTSHTACQTVVTRTYVAVDACDNHSNTITEIITLNNDYKPVITGRIDVKPVRDTACTYDVPSYAVLRNIFNTDTNIKVTYHCPESAFDTVVFYMNNTNVVADGNLNIFADTDLVTIYAVVTDTCNNSSVKTPVFDIHKPAPMYIAHGSITLDTLELCADVTTNMHFNDNFVMNADRPYTYQWSQISEVGQSIITPDPNNYLEAVVAPENQMLNTSSHFIMTVTDSLGCVASDTSNAIHFYRLPTAEIISHPGNTGNPINDGDTLCPNYGDFYTMVGPNSASNLPDSVINYQSLGYTWSGASDLLDHHSNVNMFKMACENCDTLYTTYLTVTNMKNCSATTAFNIYGVIRSLPVITAITEITRPLVAGPGCNISVPDFVGNNLYFNPLTVQDECFSLSEMHITQDVPAGTLINHDTNVVITISAPHNQNNPHATPCWTVTHTIAVKMPANTIHISSITAADVDCEPVTTTLTPTVENAVGTVNYAWSTGANTETINVTMTYAAHTYTLSVTDQTTGCANSMTVSPTVYRVPVVADFEFVTTPNTYCSTTTADGTFTIRVLNDSTANISGFGYNGNTYALTDTVFNLVDGEYTFTIYTSDGCSATFTDTVRRDTTDANAPFVAEVLRHNYRCETPYEGSIAVTPNVENYVYSIDGDTHFTDGEVITSHATVITPIMFNWLYQDTYRVYVVSPKGCHFVTNDVTVNDIRVIPTAPTVTFDTADCTLDNGIIYIANTNPTFTYSVDGVLKPGNNGMIAFTGISVGSHPISILSSGNCLATFPFEMPSRTAVPAQPTLTIHNNEYCDYMFGGVHGQNGSVTVPANQVMTGYTYTFNGETVTGVAGTAVVFDSLADNTYSMTIKDVHSCGITFNVIVPHTQHVFDTVKAVYTNGSDCAHADNKVQITNPNNAYNYFLARWAYDASDGQYKWFINRDADAFVAPDYTLDSLADGWYMVFQEHKVFECTYALPYEYLHVVKPVYHITATHVDDQDCSALGTGSITITNPNPNFTYSLNGVDTTVFTGLNGNGGINYTVHAFNNVTSCNYDTTITISLNSYIPVIDTVVSTPNFYCTTEKNGTITVTLDSVVTGTYHLWDASANEIASNATGVFTGLNSGDYYVYFESAYHCESALEAINVKDSAFFTADFVITPNFTCVPTLNLPGTGCIYVMDPHNVAPNNNYTYSLTLPGVWSDRDIDIPSYKWCSLASNNYNVEIVDTVTGCRIDTVLFVPDSSVNITLNVVKVDNNVCTGTGNGSLTVTATADNLDAVLVYSIDGGTTWHANGSTISNLDAGAYEIIVHDEYFNCTYDTCSNKDVVINTVEKELNPSFTTSGNNACEPTLWNGSIVINSVEYLDGTTVDYTASIKHTDNSDVDYATTITNGWGHLNGITYLVTIHDNTTGCDSTFEVTVPATSSCALSTNINITAENNNKHVGSSFYFCYGEPNGKLIAEATSPCDTDFTYSWTSVCAHSSSNTAEVDVYTAETFCCKYYVTVVGVETGCSRTDSVTVCVDELPIIQFYATGANISYVGANPTVTYTNCENYEFTFGVVDPGFDSIIWANGYVDTNVASFTVPAYTLTEGTTSYCVWVMDQNGCSAGYTAANVITRPIATFAKDTSSCGTFDYVSHRAGAAYHYVYDPAGTNVYTVVDTFYAVNACDSIVTYTVTINANPTLTVTTLPSGTVFCHGDDTHAALFDVVTTNEDYKGYCIADAAPATKAAFMTDAPFTPTAPITRAMNGKIVYAYAYNSCDTVYDVIGMLVVDSLPTVNGVTATTTHFCKGSLCPGSDLTASVTAWNNDGLTTPQTQKWYVSADENDFSAATEISTFSTADSGKYVTFAATNHCGTTYGTPVKVHVDSVAAPVLTLNTTEFCAGDVITLADFNITHLSTATPTDTTYTYGGTAYTLGTDKLAKTAGTNFFVSVQYDVCGSTVPSNTVSIVVNDTANLVVPTTNDTLCVSTGAYTFTVNMNAGNTISVSSSDPTKATAAVGTTTATSAEITVTPLVGGDNVTVTITSTAAGSCGNKTEDVTIFIADTADNFATVANVNACAGGILSLTAPTYDANANVYSEGWLLGGVAFDPTSYHVQYPADSGKTLTYFVANVCGTGHSNDAILHVKDTAHLTFATTITPTDTLCIGANNTITDIIVHSSNAFTYDATPAGLVTITKTGNEKGAGATLTMEGVAEGNVTITLTSTSLCGDVKTETVSFRVSDKRVVARIPAAPAAVCEGEVLTMPTMPTPTSTGTANIYNEGWQVMKSSETSFSDFVTTTPMTLAYNGAKLRYMVNTICGESYSDTVNITVNDTATLISPINLKNQVICDGAAIADIQLTSNRTSFVLDVNLSDAGLSIDATGKISATAVTAPASVTFPYTLKGAVKTVSTYCTTYDKVDTVIILINAAPTATLTVPNDTLCADGATAINPTLSVTQNHNTETATETYYMKKKADATFNTFTITTPVTADMDSALVFCKVANTCGDNNSDTVVVRVAGTLTVDITPVQFRDTCEGLPLSDFIVSGTPTVTPETPATLVDSAFWFKKVGSNYVKLTLDSIMTNPTELYYGAYTKCNATPYYSNKYDLGFDAVPSFVTTPPFVGADFRVCEGDLFTEPTLVLGTDILPLTPDVTKTWTLNGSAMDFAVAYDHATYDGKEIKLVISNACGADSAMANVTIDTLPVPHMLADTTICATGTEQFRLEVANVHAGSSYEWKNSDGTHFDDGSSLLKTAAAIDTIMRFYVVETDANGCISTIRVNVTPEYINDTLITIRVTNKPYFTFTNMAGDTTHHIKSSINNTTTAFKWTLSDECFSNPNQKVFVKFAIYHDGVLIPDAEISHYLTTATTTIGMTTHTWNTNQGVSFLSGDGSVTLNDMAFYTAMDNHYPHSNFVNAAYQFDWLYLHFVTSRFFTNTFSQFIQTGDYDIHYELYATDGGDINYYYKDGTTKKIGGMGYTGATLLSSDVFHIHVDDGPAYAGAETPDMPQPIDVDEPTVKVYPNPASQNVNVRMEGINGQTTIRIATLTGKTVAQRSVNIDNNFSVETFNVSDLTPGVYVLQIVNDEAVLSRKLVITK